MDYNTELLEYAVMAYMECIGDMIKLMTEREVKAAILILGKVKKSYGSLISPSQSVRVELPKASPITSDG